MHLIKLFVIGTIGYIFSGLYDLSILYNKTILKRIFYTGFFITAVPYPWLFFMYRSPLPALVTWIIIILMSVFAGLLIYSVLLEIPLKSKKNERLYKRGTYGISRHPGFLWYTVLNILIAAFFWNIWIFVLCVGLITCNLILVIIEDILLFPKMFSGYEEYRSQIPFFVSFKSVNHRREKRW